MLSKVGVYFGEIGGIDEPKQCCNVMVEAPNPPQTAPHIHITYIQSVLAPSYAVDGDIWLHHYYTLAPVKVGGNFWKIEVWLMSSSDVVMSQLRLQTPHRQHPTSILQI